MVEKKQRKEYRKYGFNELSSSLSYVTKPIFREKGFFESNIIFDWEKIMGVQLGANSSPRRLSFARGSRTEGILYVDVYDSSLAMEMTYLEPLIIEKLAVYFGYKLVGKIKILQKPNKQLSRPEENSPLYSKSDLSKDQEIRLNHLLEDIEDENLKKSLESLGCMVMSEDDTL